MRAVFQVKEEYLMDTTFADVYEDNVKCVVTHKDFYRVTYNPTDDGCFVEKCFPKTYFELRGVFENKEE